MAEEIKDEFKDVIKNMDLGEKMNVLSDILEDLNHLNDVKPGAPAIDAVFYMS